MASTRLAEVPRPGGKGARNSLLLYFAMMNLSLSSCRGGIRLLTFEFMLPN